MSVIAAGDGWIDEAVKTGGYPALAGLILAENLFPPIPSELILPLAGFYVGKGELIFLLAVLAATIGSVVGALILYGARGAAVDRSSTATPSSCASRRATSTVPTHGSTATAPGSCSSVD